MLKLPMKAIGKYMVKNISSLAGVQKNLAAIEISIQSVHFYWSTTLLWAEHC